MNASVTYPAEIQSVLDLLVEQGFEDTWQALSERDKDLTRTLCCSDTCDFIVIDGQDAFLFTEVSDRWEVAHVGHPVYEIESEMIGVDFESFLVELQFELKGVDVKRGSALSNAKSEFVDRFKNKIDKAFVTALANL